MGSLGRRCVVAGKHLLSLFLKVWRDTLHKRQKALAELQCFLTHTVGNGSDNGWPDNEAVTAIVSMRLEDS
jgi:hypothetical protein